MNARAALCIQIAQSLGFPSGARRCQPLASSSPIIAAKPRMPDLALPATWTTGAWVEINQQAVGYMQSLWLKTSERTLWLQPRDQRRKKKEGKKKKRREYIRESVFEQEQNKSEHYCDYTELIKM